MDCVHEGRPHPTASGRAGGYPPVLGPVLLPGQRQSQGDRNGRVLPRQPGGDCLSVRRRGPVPVRRSCQATREDLHRLAPALGLLELARASSGQSRQGDLAASRSSRRWILPLVVLASPATNSTSRGYLYGAVRCLTKSCSSLASSADGVRPGWPASCRTCLLYTSDAADEEDSVDL